MEAENLLLIGLTLLLALVGGAALRRRARESSGKPLDTGRSDAPVQQEMPARVRPSEQASRAEEVKPRSVVLAVNSTAGKLRIRGGADVGGSDDLFVRGSHWWAGTREEWDRKVEETGWLPATALPGHENSVVIVSFELVGEHADVPASRLSGAMLLRQAANRDGVRVGAYYAVPPGVALGPLGFKR